MWPDVLAHVLPVQHGGGGDATLTIGLLTLGVLASAFVGAMAGDELSRRLRRSLLAAWSAGMLLFLVYDLLKETASLGQGLLSDLPLMLGILASFAIGTLILPTLGKPESGARVVWAWTLGIGFHSLGEGYTLGTEAASADLSGVAGISSFLLHKGMEVFTVPILLGAALGWKRGLLAALGLAWATLLGALAGLAYGATVWPLFFFAAGAGTVAIAIMRLARTTQPDTRHAVFTLAGVLVVFAAGLLHEI